MVAAPTQFETPSKVAASALSTLDLTKPESINEKLGVSTNALRKEHKKATEVDQTSTNGRDRFVGNLDIKSDADEPLLKPTDNRFVLFPIKYHEVSSLRLAASFPPRGNGRADASREWSIAEDRC